MFCSNNLFIDVLASNIGYLCNNINWRPFIADTHCLMRTEVLTEVLVKKRVCTNTFTPWLLANIYGYFKGASRSPLLLLFGLLHPTDELLHSFETSAIIYRSIRSNITKCLNIRLCFLRGTNWIFTNLSYKIRASNLAMDQAVSRWHLSAGTRILSQARPHGMWWWTK